MRSIRTILILATLAVAAGGAFAAESSDAGVKWYSYEEGLAAAKAAGKPVVIDFHADWCKWCKEMDAKTFSDARVIEIMNGRFIPISVDTEKEKAPAQAFNVQSLPTMWFLDAQGERIDTLPGFVDADFFVIVLDYIASESYKSVDFGKYMEDRS